MATTLKTQHSIFSNGRSYDVWSGNIASVNRQVEDKMKEDYSMDSDPYIRVLKNVEIEGELYTLCESYYDSGSEDYYFFAVKFISSL